MTCTVSFAQICKAVGSDQFANLIALTELIIALVTIIIGGKKVSELITEYKAKRLDATFGFYTNLVYFVKRIRILVVADDGSPQKSLYLLSPNKDLRSDGSQELGEKLSATALECLQYLSSASNQIPPAETNEERKQWKVILDSFVDLLNDFYLIGCGVYLPEFWRENVICDYCKKANKIFSDIVEKSEKESNDIFTRMSAESKKAEAGDTI